MPASELFKYFTIFNEDNDHIGFLNYSPRPLIKYTTLYENLKYFDDSRLEDARSDCYGGWTFLKDSEENSSSGTTKKWGLHAWDYDYIPYQHHYEWGDCLDMYNKQYNIDILKYFKQYQVKALYNLPESLTIEEVKQSVLVPLFDQLFKSETILTNLLFINRISTRQVLFDFIWFTDENLERDEIERIIPKANLISLQCFKIDERQYDYWFCRLHCEIFHNSNYYTATFLLFSFSIKSSFEINWKYGLRDEEFRGRLLQLRYMFDDTVAKTLVGDWLDRFWDVYINTETGMVCSLDINLRCLTAFNRDNIIEVIISYNDYQRNLIQRENSSNLLLTKIHV